RRARACRPSGAWPNGGQKPHPYLSKSLQLSQKKPANGGDSPSRDREQAVSDPRNPRPPPSRSRLGAALPPADPIRETGLTSLLEKAGGRSVQRLGRGAIASRRGWVGLQK